MVDPGLPAIHPSFIQVANPYIFEQTVENCIESMGVNPLRETSLRLQGVAWLDGVRRALNLYVDSKSGARQEDLCIKILTDHTGPFAHLTRLWDTTTDSV